MPDLSQIRKLIGKLDILSGKMNQSQSIALHREVNQFYHMQKAEELSMLHDQQQELLARLAGLQQLSEFLYREASTRWANDSRIMIKLNRADMQEQSCRQDLSI